MQTERTSLLSVKNLLVVAFAVAIAYGISTYIVSERLQNLEQQAELLAADQESVLVAIAETTARNGADAITESIIQDCSLDERDRFEELLNGLNSGLPRTELVELERLFGRCGGFFAERKAVMVARLSREIEVYESYILQLEEVTGRQVAEANLSEWQTLAAEERKQSQLFSELVQKQDEIISALLAGNSPDSEEVTDILREVTEIQGNLIVANQQAANLRSNLVNL